MMEFPNDVPLVFPDEPVRTYYLNCPKDETLSMVTKAIDVGVASTDDNGNTVSGKGSVWDLVGDKDGNTLVNVITEIDLLTTDLAPYVLVNADGKPKAPEFPIRVFL